MYNGIPKNKQALYLFRNSLQVHIDSINFASLLQAFNLIVRPLKVEFH